jgi:hypothetical protein
MAESAIVARIKYSKKYDSPFSKGISFAEAGEEATEKTK